MEGGDGWREAENEHKSVAERGRTAAFNPFGIDKLRNAPK